jgi:hypothetical protein
MSGQHPGSAIVTSEPTAKESINLNNYLPNNRNQIMDHNQIIQDIIREQM